MKGVAIDDTSILFYDINSKTPSHSSKRKWAVQVDHTQEMNGEVDIDIPMMATKNYNKINVSSLRNESRKIIETQ